MAAWQTRALKLLVGAAAIAALVTGAVLVHDANAPSPKSSHPPTATSTPADRGSAPTHGATTASGQSRPTATSTACVARSKTRKLTVVTFNIHSARVASSGRPDLPGIARELQAMDPDIVLLQEVDRGREWTNRVDMPKALASDLKMAWTFGANVVRTPTNQYGTAILSRFPITYSDNTELPRPAGTQQRGLLHAVLDVNGLKLSVYDVHLEAHSAVARTLQIRKVAQIIGADHRPRLLGGDFNAPPGSDVHAIARSVLDDTWNAVGHGRGLSAPGSGPRVRIDYLYYGDGRSSTTLTPLSAQVMPESAVSDHRPVLAVYRLHSKGATICVPKLR